MRSSWRGESSMICNGPYLIFWHLPNLQLLLCVFGRWFPRPDRGGVEDDIWWELDGTTLSWHDNQKLPKGSPAARDPIIPGPAVKHVLRVVQPCPKTYQVVPGTRRGGSFEKGMWLIGIHGELERSELKWNQMHELTWINWNEWLEMNELKRMNWNERLDMNELKWTNWNYWLNCNLLQWKNWKEWIDMSELKRMNRHEWLEMKELKWRNRNE